jgi:hypothetical protein
MSAELKHGAHVRLPDGKVGHIVGHTLDGVSVVADGRLVHALPKDVTEIPAPHSPPIPEPQRSANAPIQTSHEPPPAQVIANPNRLPVLVSGKWSDPQ